MKKILRKIPIISFFVKKYEERQTKKRIQKKLDELRKRDPFIYKSY